MLLPNGLAYFKRMKGCLQKKSIIRTSNGLTKSGRSLVLSAKAFPGGDV